MDISTLLSGAGQVSTGVRDREAELRRAREEQLALEALNRQNQLRKEQAAAPIPQVGQMDPFPAQRPDLPGRPAPAPAAPAAAPRAGVQPNKPAVRPVPLNTTEARLGVEQTVSDPRQMTREQFLQLSPRAQKEMYDRYVSGLVKENRLNRGPRDEFGVSIPTGLPQKPVPKNIQEFIAGLPNTRGSSAAKRGRPRKAGVAAPGNLAMDADTAIQNVLGVEGGYVNDKDDRGGETNLGISSRANPDVDVKSLTPDKAAALYKERYWDAINADQLPPAIREIAFDTAVNMGPSTAIRLAQLSGGDPQRYLAERKKLYDAIVANDPGQRKFYDGWMNRLEGLAAKLGGAVIPSANAADMPAPVATLAANNGPALREAVAAAGATPRPQGSQRPQQPTYSPDPAATSQSMRIALQQRDELVRMAGMYQRSGMGQEYMQVRQQIMALDNSLVDIAGMHGISEMELTGSTARLAQAWSTKVGVPIELQRRQDNTYDILVNGRPEAQYVPAGEIMDTALSIFDPQYRERKGAWADKEHEARLKINEVMAGKTGDMIKELYVAQQKGALDKELEWLKMNMGWEIKGPAGDGTYLIKPPGDSPFYFDPAGGEIEIDGVKVPVTGARRVGGLSTPAGR